MNYAQLVTEDIRLVILRVLQQDPDYSHNEYIIQRLLARFGHNISTDKVRTELAWLEENGLIRTARTAGDTDVIVAKLTARGDDVGSGRTVVPGVQRPRPEE
jgi:repressor of nif and glnA expression